MTSKLIKCISLLVATLIPVSACCAETAEPRTTDGYKLELLAADPQIVTPIGMTFDQKGRLLVIESQTHERQPSYKGLPSDRIRMISDSDADGKLDHWTTFAEGFSRALNLVVGKDGTVFVACRNSIIRLRDTDGDGVADQQDELLNLKTTDDYSHNAINGITLDADRNIVFSFGENHGVKYRLAAADGTVIEDTGGQDGFFRMTTDGKNLHRFARGVWNPFGICALPDGRIFAVDNDPDSSPPCRMLHIVPGGDYGYLFQYGRAGTNPLQAWNAELPGALPIVCGVGEAPTAIVPHAGALWVTSWGDHRIERYELVPRGASYDTKRTVIVQGVNDFRPTGMAVAPDGSLYFGDWVLLDYPVHGRGRIWHLTLPPGDEKIPFPSRTKEDLATSGNEGDAIQNANSPDPFLHAHGVYQLSQQEKVTLPPNASPRLRLAALEAAWLRRPADVKSMLRAALADESPDVRLYAVRWIADEHIADLRDDVAKLLDGSQPSRRYYLAVLAAIDWLARNRNKVGSEMTDNLLISELESSARSSQIHALALSLIKPDNKFLTLDRLKGYLESNDQKLRLEAIRTLAQQTNDKRFELLATVAGDDSQSDAIRAEAIVGMSAVANDHRDQLEKLAASDNAVLKREAARALQLAGVHPANATETKPPAEDLTSWNKLLATPGDAAAGRRLFFSPVGPRCSVCHTYAGRGGIVGPELTSIGRNTPRESIITSILQPSREIAPDYQPWVLVTNDGKTLTGLLGIRGGVHEKEEYIDETGKTFTVNASDIESRQASTKSIMPDNLQASLTIDDLRDLVTFLSSPADGAAAAK